MADDLHDQLTEIRGVGDATADAILAVLDERDSDAVREHVEAAHEHHEAGEHAYAAKYVRRAADALDDE